MTSESTAQDLPRTIVGVAPGAGLDPNLISDLADIDPLFTDAAFAMSDLDRLIQIRSRAETFRSRITRLPGQSGTFSEFSVNLQNDPFRAAA